MMFRELLDLFLTFFKIGSVTFGGGYAMLPILERELVDKKKWATYDDLLDYYAISQVTPGVIAVNVSTFVGYRRRKIPGGIAATLGVVCPSIIIITVIAMFISNFQDIVWVQKALKGINVGVAALLTFAVVNFAKKSIKKWWGVIFYALSFAAIYFLKLPSVAVIVASAVFGVLITWLTGGLKKVEMMDASSSGENEPEKEKSVGEKKDGEECSC
ncbi:MAG: chromate transporter [Treponema sp.]|nr:chromate transporter [Treponema sp.]